MKYIVYKYPLFTMIKPLVWIKYSITGRQKIYRNSTRQKRKTCIRKLKRFPLAKHEWEFVADGKEYEKVSFIQLENNIQWNRISIWLEYWWACREIEVKMYLNEWRQNADDAKY